MLDLWGGWKQRPASVWTLAAGMAVGSLLLALGALFPPVPETPVGIQLSLAVVAATLAGGLWIFGARARWVRQAALAVVVAGIALLTATAGTPEGVVAVASSFVWICLYTASTYRPRTTRLVTVLGSGLLGAAMLANGRLVNTLFTWLMVASSALLAGEVLSRLHHRLHRLASSDPLTGARNRDGLHRDVAERRALRRFRDRPFVIVAIDLDGFKAVNDHGGHAAGDDLLRGLVAEWQDALRADDVLARVGGDEFVLVLPDTEQADAEHLLARLRLVSRGRWTYGVTSLLPDEPLETALRRADAALYAGKVTGAA